MCCGFGKFAITGGSCGALYFQGVHRHSVAGDICSCLGCQVFSRLYIMVHHTMVAYIQPVQCSHLSGKLATWTYVMLSTSITIITAGTDPGIMKAGFSGNFPKKREWVAGFNHLAAPVV